MLLTKYLVKVPSCFMLCLVLLIATQKSHRAQSPEVLVLMPEFKTPKTDSIIYTIEKDFSAAYPDSGKLFLKDNWSEFKEKWLAKYLGMTELKLNWQDYDDDELMIEFINNFIFSLSGDNLIKTYMLEQEYAVSMLSQEIYSNFLQYHLKRFYRPFKYIYLNFGNKKGFKSRKKVGLYETTLPLDENGNPSMEKDSLVTFRRWTYTDVTCLTVDLINSEISLIRIIYHPLTGLPFEHEVLFSVKSKAEMIKRFYEKKLTLEFNDNQALSKFLVSHNISIEKSEDYLLPTLQCTFKIGVHPMYKFLFFGIVEN